jgi:hypothetical protein
MDGERLHTVDRPTARRKRHANSANSVTVAELQAKSTPAEQASVSAIQARAAVEAQARTAPMRITVDGPEYAEEPVAEQSRPDEVVDEPRVSSRLAMTIVAMVVAMVACGVVTAVAALGGERPHRLSPGAPAIQPALITGPAVVRMDVILGELAPGTPGGRPITTTTAERPLQAPLADRAVASQVVVDFYGSLATRERREEAFELLGPTMRGNGATGFEAAWFGTGFAEAHVLPNDEDDAVWAEVSVHRPSEGNFYVLVVRIEVRLVDVSGALLPRFVGAQLLSAHRG